MHPTERRKILCENTPSCPKCGESFQIQLKEWIEQVVWKCRTCKHKWDAPSTHALFKIIDKALDCSTWRRVWGNYTVVRDMGPDVYKQGIVTKRTYQRWVRQLKAYDVMPR